MHINKTKNKLNRTKKTALERERLVSLINSMADAVIAIDESLTILVYNGAALNILDINEDVSNQKIATVLKIWDGEKIFDINKLLSSLKTQYTNRDLIIKYSNDDYINVFLSIAPVHLGYKMKGNHGFVIIMRDITNEKSLEEERDEFISVVSHELRTPIAIAEGNLSNAMLIAERDNNASDKVTSALKASYEQIMFLSGMINDLATLSRAERGTLNIEIESINVFDLIDELKNDYSPAAEEKNLELIVHKDSNLELIMSSKLYVKEILQNFITNAIKYTEKGSIEISGSKYKSGVIFKVKDTGIGISKADKEKIFDKFYRSEDYRTRSSKGTGLGLYVSMKLAKMLGAEIELESEIDKGSIFTIYIPNLNN